jgi:hypothetical protein
MTDVTRKEVGAPKVVDRTTFDAQLDALVIPPLSPHHRFVIAFHSPEAVFETGLFGCPSEKKAANLPYSNF